MNLFTELSMPESIQAALEKLNFVEATPIQKKAIPILMKNKDLIACSETGSGKTAAYALPMILQLLEDDQKCGLILAPTRELAQQINEFVDSLLIKETNFNVVRLVGGSDIRKQFKKLQKKTRLIVATPGRLIDHLKRNTVQLHKTEYLVLDEGDRMIDMGFAPQLKEILSHLPAERQTSFFTATLDEKVKKLAAQYLYKPEKITIGTASRPVSNIKQNVMQVELKHKDECLVNELNAREGSIIVFLKTKYRTDRMCKYLQDYGFSADQVHGGCTQGQRNKAIRNFKAGKIRILCATDVAARGLDVPQVEHVINVDLPMQDEDYVHRIGRTARNGAEGEALSFVMPQEHRYWNMLARKYNIVDVTLPETSSSKSRSSGRRNGEDSSRGRRSAKGARPSARGGDSYGKSRSAGGSKAKKRNTSRESDSYSEDKPKRSFGGKKMSSSKSKGSGFSDDKPKRSFSRKESSSSRDQGFGDLVPKRSFKAKKKTSAETPAAKASRKASGARGPKKKGKTFKKSGGFKKSRAKQNSRRPSA